MKTCASPTYTLKSLKKTIDEIHVCFLIFQRLSWFSNLTHFVESDKMHDNYYKLFYWPATYHISHFGWPSDNIYIKQCGKWF